MKRWKSAVGHCSFSSVFSRYMIFSATHPSSVITIRAPATFRLVYARYVGAAAPPSILPHRKLLYSSVTSAWKSENKHQKRRRHKQAG